jgi:hypothetical protein
MHMGIELREATKLLEETREEIQNLYGRDTSLTERITAFLELHGERDSIFSGIQVNDSKQAFDHAIRRGLKNPEDYMYMHSTRFLDYFKHCDTRAYRSFINFGNIFWRRTDRSR